MEILKRLWVRGLALAVLAAVAGCSSSIVPLRVTDYSSPTVSVRGTYHGGAGDSPRRSGPGVEVGYESFQASGSQMLLAGESLWVDNGIVTGPQALAHEARLRQAHVAYNHRIRIGQSFELEPFIGATYVRLKVQTEAANGDRFSVDSTRNGWIVGLTPRWRFSDSLAVEGRCAFLAAAPELRGQSYEAALVLSPAQNVSLRLGYSGRKYDAENLWSIWVQEPTLAGRATATIRARGPMATLQFDF